MATIEPLRGIRGAPEQDEMSLDKSLKSKDTLARHRNVLTRAERVDAMEETGTWTKESNVIGMPKFGHRKVSLGKKTKKKGEGEGDKTEGDEKKDAS